MPLTTILCPVLLVEETGVPEENHRTVTDKLYHIMLERDSLTTSVVIGTDCKGSVNPTTI
jgi:hypothetical protein